MLAFGKIRLVAVKVIVRRNSAEISAFFRRYGRGVLAGSFLFFVVLHSDLPFDSNHESIIYAKYDACKARAVIFISGDNEIFVDARGKAWYTLFYR